MPLTQEQMNAKLKAKGITPSWQAQKKVVTPTPTPQKQTTFGERAMSSVSGTVGGVFTSLAKRASNIATIKNEASTGGLRTRIMTPIRAIGEAAGAVGDVVTEGAKGVFHLLKEEDQEKVKKGIGGTLEAVGVTDAMKKYEEWALKHPEAAKDIEATVNIASMLPIGKAGQLAKTSAKSVAKKTGLETAEKMASKVGKATEEATEIYRSVLRPTAGEVKNIEIRKGKNIDDSYKLIAENDIPINKTPDNRLDTVESVATIESKIDPLEEELDTILASKPERSFNLQDFAEKAKAEIKAQKGISATAKKDQMNDIDEYIKNEIEDKFGENWESEGMLPNVTAKELNEIKRGLWKEGYRADKPTAQKSARKLGHIIKEEIETAFPDVAESGVNQKIADFVQAKTLLENAHGRVVAGGQLGKGSARVIGAIAGATTKIPVVGSIVGEKAGEAIQQWATNPSRLTKSATSKIKKAKSKQAKFMSTK